MLKMTDAFKSTYAGGHLGLLIIRNVCNPKNHEGLEVIKKELEGELKQKYNNYTRPDYKNSKAMQIYDQYYKKFNKTYHVMLQLESVVSKGKQISRNSTLVEAMFMAELKNHLLTAGHNLSSLDLPLQLDVACENKKYKQITGDEKEITSGDMIIADGKGIVSSVVYGPDYRTRITNDTQDTLFTVYGPPGIEGYEIFDHLQDIKSYIGIFSPNAEVDLLKVYDTK